MPATAQGRPEVCVNIERKCQRAVEHAQRPREGTARRGRGDSAAAQADTTSAAEGPATGYA
eukprot:8091996-Pyramimonas_sp.AAC.1